MNTALAVVILAAGKGTRMKNPDLAKVMYPINNRPMIDYVVDLATGLDAGKIIAVVGWQKDAVKRHLVELGHNVVCVEQSPQLGTGHAVMQAEPALAGFEGDVLVLSGDVPLLSLDTLRRLIDHHRTTKAVATVLTTNLPDATGYGRIIRNRDGSLRGIVEHKDASDAELQIGEINSGIYVFKRGELFEGLSGLTQDNAQREYYLTDVFHIFSKKQLPLAAVAAPDPREVQGINTIEQLEELRAVLAPR